MQPAQGCDALDLRLLVREGGRAKALSRLAASFMWPDVRQAASLAQGMSSSLRTGLSRWALSAMSTYGPQAIVFLRQ